MFASPTTRGDHRYWPELHFQDLLRGSALLGDRLGLLAGSCAGFRTQLILDRSLPDPAKIEVLRSLLDAARYLPRPVPQSVPEDQEALRTLLAIESDRVAGARAATSDLVLMDRSVHTLLAHRYALQRLIGLACLTPAEGLIAQSQAPAWPDLVLYVASDLIPPRDRGFAAIGA
jgi:hypothetical protein